MIKDFKTYIFEQEIQNYLITEKHIDIYNKCLNAKTENDFNIVINELNYLNESGTFTEIIADYIDNKASNLFQKGKDFIKNIFTINRNKSDIDKTDINRSKKVNQINNNFEEKVNKPILQDEIDFSNIKTIKMYAKNTVDIFRINNIDDEQIEEIIKNPINKNDFDFNTPFLKYVKLFKTHNNIYDKFADQCIVYLNLKKVDKKIFNKNIIKKYNKYNNDEE